MFKLFLITYSIIITVECYRLYNNPVNVHQVETPTRHHVKQLYELEKLNDIFYKLHEKERKEIQSNYKANNLDSVLRYFDNYGVSIPNELIIQMLRIDNIYTKIDMFKYLNTTRKNYAKDISKSVPATKEAMKQLKD